MSEPPPQRQDKVIGVPAAEAGAQAPALTVWQYYPWAGEWFEDAKREAAFPGRGPRRREILFAATLAESYLVEWVMVQVLADTRQKQRDQFRDLAKYFPESDRSGLPKRWKRVTKQLAGEGLIDAAPDFGDEDWREFQRLFSLRNGFIHAHASRPYSSSEPDLPLPSPAISELDELEPGWAVKVVALQAKKLHQAAGFPTPEWLR